MPQPQGIRTLEDLGGRCVIDDITDCWVFQVDRRSKIRPEGWGANVWLPEQKRTDTLQRAAWYLAGRPMGRSRDWTVWRKCHNEMCCNPGHLMAGPRRLFGKWVKSTGKWRGDPARAATNRRIKIATGQAKINQELAGWIRQSKQSGVEVAHALDVSPHCVSRVRSGQTWREAVNGASVFTWAGGR